MLFTKFTLLHETDVLPGFDSGCSFRLGERDSCIGEILGRDSKKLRATNRGGVRDPTRLLLVENPFTITSPCIKTAANFHKRDEEAVGVVMVIEDESLVIILCVLIVRLSWRLCA
jgi:hypothetical protein